MTMKDSLDIQLVPATQEHRSRIFEISAQVWEGDDYIHNIWEEWLKEGGFFIILYQGQVAGCAKYTEQLPAEFLMEGLRVDPTYKGKGLASATIDRMLEMVMEKDPKVLRFATSNDNVVSHHLGKKHGFGFVTSFYFRYLLKEDGWSFPREAVDVEAEAVGRKGEGAVEETAVVELGQSDLLEVLDCLEKDPNWPGAKGFLPRGWVVYQAEPAFLREQLGRGLCLAVKQNGVLQGLLLGDRDQQRPGTRDISWLSGNLEIMGQLFLEFMKRAELSGADMVDAKLVSREQLEFLERKGFNRHPGVESLEIYEKRIHRKP